MGEVKFENTTCGECEAPSVYIRTSDYSIYCKSCGVELDHCGLSDHVPKYATLSECSAIYPFKLPRRKSDCWDCWGSYSLEYKINTAIHSKKEQ